MVNMKLFRLDKKRVIDVRLTDILDNYLLFNGFNVYSYVGL